MIAVKCTLYSIGFLFVPGLVPHPKVKLFVSFVDNAMMIIVDSKFTLLFSSLVHVKKLICKWTVSHP